MKIQTETTICGLQMVSLVNYLVNQSVGSPAHPISESRLVGLIVTEGRTKKDGKICFCLILDNQTWKEQQEKKRYFANILKANFVLFKLLWNWPKSVCSFYRSFHAWPLQLMLVLCIFVAVAVLLFAQVALCVSKSIHNRVIKFVFLEPL